MVETNTTPTILNEVRDILVGYDDDAFDKELSLYINGLITPLVQIGVLQDTTLKISDLSREELKLHTTNVNSYAFEDVILYIQLNTKLVFDPPTGSTVPIFKDAVASAEWRLREAYDTTYTNGTEGVIIEQIDEIE